MEIGIHLVPAKNLYYVAERYTNLLDRICPDCIWLSDRLLVDDYGALAAYCGRSIEDWARPAEFLDPFVAAAALVQYMPQPTRFGIAATDFIRRPPPDLARAAFTLNQVLPTPLHLGIGAGEAINLVPLGYDTGPKPVAHFEQSLRQLRQIHATGACHGPSIVEVGYQGHASSIWVAGQRPRMLRIAAALADGWLPAWKMSPVEYRDSVQALRQGADKHGRSGPVPGLFAMPLIGPSRSDLLDHFRSDPLLRTVAFMAADELWQKWGLQHPAGAGSRGLFDTIVGGMPGETLYRALQSVPAEMIGDILFLGNVQELLDEFWQYREAGLQHLSLLLPDFSNPRISYGVPNFEAEFERLCRELQSW